MIINAEVDSEEGLSEEQKRDQRRILYRLNILEIAAQICASVASRKSVSSEDTEGALLVAQRLVDGAEDCAEAKFPTL